MTENTLHILIKLFAYISHVCGDTITLAKSFVEVFLTQQFSAHAVRKQLELFETEFDICKLPVYPSAEYQETVEKIIFTYCNELNKSLTLNQKFLVLLNLLEFVKLRNEKSNSLFMSNIVTKAAELFKIDYKEFLNCKFFIEDRIFDAEGKNNILVITGSKITGTSGIRYLLKEGLKGYIRILKIDSIHSYLFIVSGDDHLEINDQHIFKRHVYFFNKGSSIRSSKIRPLYFSDVEQSFVNVEPKKKIVLTVENLVYEFFDHTIGIHQLSLSAFSGQMVAIMGGSGSGKSTFLNLLNGNLKPTKGRILINDVDINKHKKQIHGLMGYVPQDDTLFEELSVYQNLYFSTKLCLGASDKKILNEKIINTLKRLDLYAIRHLKVGTPLNKFISGGQRKRLNIALELIREPSVIFVDEPTSGLSSSDSIKMIDLLKEQANNGKLLFVNIHQPSSEIIKLFDKLLIFDKGGYPVYWGNPLESLRYLKNNLNLLDAEQSECLSCGNVNPEDILLLIERKKINETGRDTEERINSPEQWYRIFIETKSKSNDSLNISSGNIPEINFKLSAIYIQFKIFVIRNLLSKFSDRQYIVISLLEAPLLALILSFFMRQTDVITHVYVFSKNENIPSYLFMGVIVALFLGLIVSSEEIIKDRKILRREEFIGLNRTAYINSKVMYLFVLSFIQIFLFVIIGNYILEIKGMTLNYCLVLWSIACFANMLGLNVSNSLQSVIAIYISIPFLLIPQILLAGVVVNFDNLHHTLASQKYVPVFGDFMVSRWGYEALAVTQFKDNKYEKYLYDFDKKISDAVYQINFKLPELIQIAETNISLIQPDNTINNSDTCKMQNNLILLQYQLNTYLLPPVNSKLFFFDSLKISLVNNQILKRTINQLENFKKMNKDQYAKIDIQKEKMIERFIEKNGMENMIKFKQNYFNEKLNNLVLDNNEFVKYTISGDDIIRKYRPVYHYPENNFGRAHFYAPVKKIGNFYMFNVAVIWLMTCFLYFILIYNLVLKAKQIFDKIIWVYRKLFTKIKNKELNNNRI